MIKKLFQQLTYKVLAPGFVLRQKYEAFKELLICDSSCHELMAWIQETYHGDSKMDLAGVHHLSGLFSEKVAAMIDCLNRMAPGDYVTLSDYHRKFDFYIRFLLAPPPIDSAPPFVLRLDQVTAETKNIGNKARNLALIRNELDGPVPDGFVVTSNSYHYFIEYNDLRDPINELLTGLDIEVSESLHRTSSRLHQLIMESEIPTIIQDDILAGYQAIDQGEQGECQVAVRSSADCEDGTSSFAGQYLTLTHVGARTLINSYQQVLASKYSPEALFYRVSQGLFDEETPMSVLILEMVDAKASGVLYTRSPLGHQEGPDLQHLHVIRGQGEQLVSGKATPHLLTLTRDNNPPPLEADQQQAPQVPIITDAITRSLGHWGMSLERFFGSPQDIEWATDASNRLSLLQTRPLRMEEAPVPATDLAPVDPETNPLLSLTGQCGSRGCASGRVYLVTPETPIDHIPAKAILVCRDTPPEYVQVMNRLAGVIAENGSTACHFATVAREFNVPVLVGCTNATRLLQPKQLITLESEHGQVYGGCVDALLPADNGDFREKSHYHRRLGPALSFITPLKLIDPTADEFTPESCRSMHDIIRFVHEKGVQSMFTAAKPGTGRGALKLQSDLPLEMFLFDVGEGLTRVPEKDEPLTIDLVRCLPFLALWKGLNHPNIRWINKPFDWDSYDKIVMAGGPAPKQDDFQFSSYGVISHDYLHLNMRFGYHFTIIDILCGDNPDANYCVLRFAGGGGDFQGRSLRLEFMSRIFQKLGFSVERKADLLEAQLRVMDADNLRQTLDLVGRLLGATKIMDMILQDDQMVDQCVDDFFHGRYNFTQED